MKNIGVRLSILTLFGDPSPYTTATYDANGNALAQTDASGNTTAFEYDHLGRLANNGDILLFWGAKVAATKSG